MATKKRKAAGKRVRSAITGRYVKKSAAKSRPKTTVSESTKKRRRSPKK